MFSRLGAARLNSRVETWAALGLAVVLGFFLVSGVIAYANIQSLRENNQRVVQTHDVLVAIDAVLSTAQDAETGQRGFLLTGSDRYLEPYTQAVGAMPERMDAVRSLTRDNPRQQAIVAQLQRRVDAKLAELAETIALRRSEGSAAALAVVQTDRGKVEMDGVRDRLAAMAAEELRLRQQYLAEMETAYRAAVVSGVLTALLGAALTVVVFLLIRRSARARARQDWLRAGQVGLAEAMGGDQTIEEVAAKVLAFLSRYAGVQAGALFKGEGGRFRRVATLGVPAEAPVPQGFALKEGLLGQVASDGQALLLTDIPDGYLTFGSALGQDKPRHLLIAPAEADSIVNAVIELGFLHQPDGRARRAGRRTGTRAGRPGRRPRLEDRPRARRTSTPDARPAGPPSPAPRRRSARSLGR